MAATYPWLISSFWAFIAASVFTSLLNKADASYEETIEMCTYITGSVSTLTMFVVGVYKKPELNSMVDTVRHEFWHDSRRPAADLLFSQFLRTYGAIMPVANVMMCIAPVAWVLQFGGTVNAPAALIFVMWTPWDRLTPATYAAVYTVQFVVSLSVLTSIAGMVYAMMLFVGEMQVQVDTLVDVVDSLDVDNAHTAATATTTATATVVTVVVPDRKQTAFADFVKCVKHHQTLIA